jgi:hypothetical protein
MIKRLTFSLILLLIFGINAEARVGVRAIGMGGAFVGVADDASAAYWNPAGLTQQPSTHQAYLGLALDNARRRDFNFDNQIFFSSKNTPAAQSAKIVMLVPPLLVIGFLSALEDSDDNDEIDYQTPDNQTTLNRSFSPFLKSDWDHDDRVPKRPENDEDEEEDDEDEEDNVELSGCSGCLVDGFDIVFDIVSGVHEESEDEEPEYYTPPPTIPESPEIESEESNFDEVIGGYLFINSDKFSEYYPESGITQKWDQSSFWLNISGAWQWRMPNQSIGLGLNYRFYRMNTKLKEMMDYSVENYDDSGYGFSVDLSVLWSTKYFRFGMISQDVISSGITFNAGEDDEWEMDILKNTQPGIAVTPTPFTTIALDVYNIFRDGGKKPQLNFGIENWFGDIGAIRLGSYKKNLTLGGSLGFSNVQVDYAYLSDKTLHFDSQNTKLEFLDKKGFANNTHLMGISIEW